MQGTVKGTSSQRLRATASDGEDVSTFFGHKLEIISRWLPVSGVVHYLSFSYSYIVTFYVMYD